MNGSNKTEYHDLQSDGLLELPEAIYRPYKTFPESRLNDYAEACLKAALRLSNDTQDIYKVIIYSWNLPGCQKVMEDFASCMPVTRTYLNNKAKAIVKREPLPDYPDEWKEVIRNIYDNSDFHQILKYIRYLILLGFNRTIDIENRAPKITPHKAPLLVQAVMFYSIIDYRDLTRQHSGLAGAMSEKEKEQFYLFTQLLASNPTTRINRQMRRRVVRTMKNTGFSLNHSQKIAEGAEMWYGCRVNPGTIETFIDKTNSESERVLERSNVEMRIAPYDEATGYPRKWRK